jgi:hypothetical protein
MDGSTGKIGPSGKIGVAGNRGTKGSDGLPDKWSNYINNTDLVYEIAENSD